MTDSARRGGVRGCRGFLSAIGRLCPDAAAREPDETGGRRRGRGPGPGLAPGAAGPIRPRIVRDALSQRYCAPGSRTAKPTLCRWPTTCAAWMPRAGPGGAGDGGGRRPRPAMRGAPPGDLLARIGAGEAEAGAARRCADAGGGPRRGLLDAVRMRDLGAYAYAASLMALDQRRRVSRLYLAFLASRLSPAGGRRLQPRPALPDLRSAVRTHPATLSNRPVRKRKARPERASAPMRRTPCHRHVDGKARKSQSRRKITLASQPDSSASAAARGRRAATSPGRTPPSAARIPVLTSSNPAVRVASGVPRPPAGDLDLVGFRPAPPPAAAGRPGTPTARGSARRPGARRTGPRPGAGAAAPGGTDPRPPAARRRVRSVDDRPGARAAGGGGSARRRPASTGRDDATARNIGTSANSAGGG